MKCRIQKPSIVLWHTEYRNLVKYYEMENTETQYSIMEYRIQKTETEKYRIEITSSGFLNIEK